MGSASSSLVRLAYVFVVRAVHSTPTPAPEQMQQPERLELDASLLDALVLRTRQRASEGKEWIWSELVGGSLAVRDSRYVTHFVPAII